MEKRFHKSLTSYRETSTGSSPDNDQLQGVDIMLGETIWKSYISDDDAFDCDVLH